MAPRMAHSHVSQVDAGWYTGGLRFSPHGALHRAAGVLKTWQLACPGVTDQREWRAEAKCLFMTQPPKSHIPQVSIGYTGEPYSV